MKSNDPIERPEVAVTSLVWALASASAPGDATVLPSGQRLQRLCELLAWNGIIWGGKFEEELASRSAELSAQLLSYINAWRRHSGARTLKYAHGGAFCTDVRVLLEAAALREATAIGRKLSWRERKAFLRRYLPSTEFLSAATETPLVDECIDRLFGLNERLVKKALLSGHRKKRLHPGEDLYLDSPPEDLYTPYTVLQDVFTMLHPKAGAHFVDLGSGLGRVGLFAGLFYPKIRFTGIELLKERAEQGIQAAREFSLSPRVKFLTANVTARGIAFPLADYYFLFNPFSASTLQAVLRRMEKSLREKKRNAYLVAVRVGRPPSHLKKVKWLRLAWQSGDYDYWDGLGFSVYETHLTGNKSVRVTAKAKPKKKQRRVRA